MFFRRIDWRAQIVMSLKIAVAAVISIALAGELGLRYSATAGIITVLSIRNTKKETLKSAVYRGIAFFAHWRWRRLAFLYSGTRFVHLRYTCCCLHYYAFALAGRRP